MKKILERTRIMSVRKRGNHEYAFHVECGQGAKGIFGFVQSNCTLKYPKQEFLIVK